MESNTSITQHTQDQGQLTNIILSKMSVLPLSKGVFDFQCEDLNTENDYEFHRLVQIEIRDSEILKLFDQKIVGTSE